MSDACSDKQQPTPRHAAVFDQCEQNADSIFADFAAMSILARQLERELAERDAELFRYREEEADRDHRAESRAIQSAIERAPTPRMRAAWDEMRAFEKKYHVGVPSQSLVLCLDLVEFYPERRAYILACDEFYKASREQMLSNDIHDEGQKP